MRSNDGVKFSELIISVLYRPSFKLSIFSASKMIFVRFACPDCPSYFTAESLGEVRKIWSRLDDSENSTTFDSWGMEIDFS